MEWSPIAPSSRGGSWGSRSGFVEVVQGQCRRATFLPLVPFHAILAKDQQVSSSMQFLEHFSTSVLHVGNQLLEGCILGSHKVLFVFWDLFMDGVILLRAHQELAPNLGFCVR